MDEDESSSSVEGEDFSALEVLKQQFMGHAHTVCRPATPVSEKIQALHRLAVLVEQEEGNYRRNMTNLFVDDRDGHPVGELLNIFTTNEALRIELLNIILRAPEQELHTAACRLAISTSVGNTPSIASTDDEAKDLVDKLVQMVTSDTSSHPLRAFATGLLAKQIEGTVLADELAKTDVPSIVVKRLIQFQQEDTLGKRNGFMPSLPASYTVNVASVSEEIDAQHPSLDKLVLPAPSMRFREVSYMIGLIAALSDYVETLAPILQLGGVDTLFYFFKSPETIVVVGIHAVFSKLLQHQKFASVFVDKGGIELLANAERIPDKSLPPAPITAISLLHLMSFPNVVEQICLLDDTVKSNFVELTLFLLTHPDEMSRKNMALFWTFAFGYKVLIDIFDAKSGFQSLVNELKRIITPQDDSEEIWQFPRMIVHHFCMAIRDYFRIQLVHMALPNLHRSLPADRPPTPRYRFMSVTEDMIHESIETLFQTEIKHPMWSWFVKEGGMTTMLQLIERSRSVSSVTMDTTRMCLDVLTTLTVDKATHAALLSTKIQPLPPQQDEQNGDDIVPPPQQPAKSAMAIVLDTLSHPNIELPQTANSALRLLTNYVLMDPASSQHATQASARRQGPRARTPHHHHAHGPAQTEAEGEAQRQASATPSRNKDLPESYRTAVRNIRAKNGISMLVSLLKVNWVTPPITASPHGADIYEVKTSIVQVMLGMAKDANSCQVLRKKVARTLPDLLRDPATSAMSPVAQSAFEKLRSETLKLIGVLRGDDAVRLADQESRAGHSHGLSQLDRAAIVSATPINYAGNELLELVVRHLQAKGLGKSAQTLVEEAGLPKELVEQHNSASAEREHDFASPAPSSTKRKRMTAMATPSTKDTVAGAAAEDGPETKKEEVTLDGIVRQFLHDQHRHCARPYSYVPQFTLKSRHSCPEPARNDRSAVAPVNVARRVLAGQLGSRFAYNNSASQWRRYKYSRIRPLRDQFGLEDTQLSSVEFLSAEKLMLSSELGDLFIFDINANETVDPIEHQLYEEAEDCRMNLDKRSRQRLLSYTWNPNETKLWDLSKMGAPLHTLPTMCAVFNTSGEQILGTVNPGLVAVYDAVTCQEVVQLYNADAPVNDPLRVVVPTSSPDDALVLCDSALWDARSGKTIYKFDMFTDEAYEAFHPSGNEVIINSEIWDLRTFKLLKTCPALDQSFFTFNASGDVIFAGVQKRPTKQQTQHTSNLRIIDAMSYEVLKDQPLEFSLVDFAVSPYDSSLGIVEKVWQRNSYCRIWELGRQRAFDDDDDDDVDDEDADEDDSLGELADVLDEEDEDDDDDDDDDSSDDLDGDGMLVDGDDSDIDDEDDIDEDDIDNMDDGDGNSDDDDDEGDLDSDDFDDADMIDAEDADETGEGVEELNYEDVLRLLTGGRRGGRRGGRGGGRGGAAAGNTGRNAGRRGGRGRQPTFTEINDDDDDDDDSNGGVFSSLSSD